MNSLKFKPNYKFPLWSGTRLSQLKSESDTLKIGESWEVSTLPDQESIIANEPDSGLSLGQFIRRDPIAVLGETTVNKFGNDLPLLFKFIDAGDDLSLQVHPNDRIAQSKGLKRGKTEMWYVLKADEGAKIIAGLSHLITFDELSESIQTNRVGEHIVEYTAKKGDLFLIEAGTLHGIGKGVMVVEIQQASDATYRLYDYDRKDASGNARELHLDEAEESLTHEPTSCKVEYTLSSDGVTPLVQSTYFTTNLVQVEQGSNQIRDLQRLKSFVVYMCTQGKTAYMDAGGNEGILCAGESLFVPASLADIVFLGTESAELLEVYIS